MDITWKSFGEIKINNNIKVVEKINKHPNNKKQQKPQENKKEIDISNNIYQYLELD